MGLVQKLFFVFFELAALTQAAHVKFVLDLTWRKGAPDGVEREMIFVNDVFPGPSLIMNEGDEVTASPNLPTSCSQLIVGGRCNQPSTIQYVYTLSWH